MHPNCVVGQDLATDVDLAQSDPRQDNRACHNEDQPERRGVYKGLAECLTGRPVVVREENNLAPDKCRRGPAKEAVCALESIMVDASVLRICEEYDADEKDQDEVRECDCSDGRLNREVSCRIGTELRMLLTGPSCISSLVA